MTGDTLFVATAVVDEGPTLKRWRARARGRVARIKKRTCHITVTLAPGAVVQQAPAEARCEAEGGAGSRWPRRPRDDREAEAQRARPKPKAEAAPKPKAAPRAKKTESEES